MKKGVVVATAVVGVLGLVTVILGIAGAASTATSLVRIRRHSCEYQATSAVGCGVVASMLAFATQIIASAATGCCGCCRAWSIPSEAKRVVAIVLSTFSWFLALIVVILFIAAAILSTATDVSTNGSGRCVPPGTGPFVAATVLFIITVIFQIISYILLQATTAKPLGQESGIAVGKPAVELTEQNAAAVVDPPPSAPPVSSDQTTSPTPTMSNEANPRQPAVSPKANADHATSQV
ncbi:uncharacterized protein LOC112271799 isoform X2 [Brachypodium distachyon]|uniref:Uncharacterized protein n=1 Tax=Brachypodium distachyon TaxID=15368 RepID=I1I303_BRADI|nr:uncharacterized protein LOC112271799 isoform X2 [Brachypodium distachyon]KQJ96138.1 hypothetical protein BRADI_3g21240v3 [Brachypodium distachyon]|eukprot:XP_024317721.1 uncharacterized protein LOC112271799 isoform X2 [Brachypodium distachyon]